MKHLCDKCKEKVVLKDIDLNLDKSDFGLFLCVCKECVEALGGYLAMRDRAFKEESS